jgi:hypothetical protein
MLDFGSWSRRHPTAVSRAPSPSFAQLHLLLLLLLLLPLLVLVLLLPVLLPLLLPVLLACCGSRTRCSRS